MSATQQDPSAAGGNARWGRIPAWWLDHPDLDADGFAVLAALSTYADEAGVCWPSQATLAAKLKRSRPTVNRILSRLEAAGLVTIEHRSSSTGGRLTCRYRLRLTPDGAVPAADSPDSSTHIPCPPASQEQHQPEQTPDSLQGRGREGHSTDGEDARERTQPAAEVPADWQPAAGDRAWAAERFPGQPIDLDAHAELFVRRCQAHGYRYRDIGAAWRAWLLQDVQAGKAPVRAGRPHSSARPSCRKPEAEQRLAAWAAVAARLDAAPLPRPPPPPGASRDQHPALSRPLPPALRSGDGSGGPAAPVAGCPARPAPPHPGRRAYRTAQPLRR
ncbi:helix-turn-helix domain-containing protein [Azospirillum thermophilum]|uniref:helix-turn-helix domain-containing protein n=1 Tax=Azospirillum thermophilum TaxID=2202148 RepID=UPI001FECAED0|nr:helix-turn-helix domain-containing protein [Azospirillum thermophilum]